MKTKKILFLIYLLFILSLKSIGQGEANFWFFGFGVELDFNSGSPVAFNAGTIHTNEGCATISNRMGNLLFYTDGIKVWNKLSFIMPNGTGLFGNFSSTESAIIVPKPGSATHYYIFTTPGLGDSVETLCYTEIDMALDGGFGDVVSGTKNTPLFAHSSEKLTAVKHVNGVDIWVIAHEFATDKFYTYLVTGAGVSSTPVISSAGSVDSTTDYAGIGYLKASADGTKLAAALRGTSDVDVLNFNTTTGVVSSDFNFIHVNAYGVEFSPNSKRLYATSDARRELYQFDMSLGTSAAIIASKTLVGTASSTYLGAIQNAPDKKMYIVKLLGDTLACVNYPDSLGIGCGFNSGSVYLAGRLGVFGLPNFIPSYFRGAPFKYMYTCLGDSTFFTLTDSVSTDSIQWNFGDPASGANNVAFNDSVHHVFTHAGKYTVMLIRNIGLVSDTVAYPVEILGIPSIYLGADTSLCAGDSITLDGGAGYTYLWQSMDTSQTFRAPAGGIYYVSATGRCGTGTDSIHISAIPLPPLVVNNDTICADQTAHLIAHGADTYTWADGATGSGSAATASPTVTTSYIITGTTGMCSAVDTAVVKVNPLPVVTVNSPTVCIGSGATLTPSGAMSYVWSTAETTSVITVTPLATTTYTLVGITSGCSDTITTTVLVVLPPVIILSPDTIIAPGSSISISASGGTDYNWYPSTGLSCTACADPVASPAQTTRYCVEVSNSVCTDTSCMTVTIEIPCPDITELRIPNIFSPNNDGNNDLFFLNDWNRCVKEFSIVIFDRWGIKVFESNDADFKWDGTHNGTALDNAVFFYCIKVQTLTDKIVERTGNIMIVR